MNKTLSLGLILIIATSYAIMVVATPANVVASTKEIEEEGLARQPLTVFFSLSPQKT